jgi:hypothetical protein
VSPAKLHETRHWPIYHRGWLLVHAAKRKLDDSADELDAIMDKYYDQHWGLEIPFGALVGMVNIVDCVRVETLTAKPCFILSDDYECGDFSPGRYGWRRGEFKRFAEPIPYRGSQGFFDVPETVFAGRAFEELHPDDIAVMREQMAELAQLPEERTQ